MSTLSVDTITDASGGTTASINGHTPTASNMAGKNRIINGAMMIDQRNAGAAVTVNSGSDFFPVDRFNCVGQSADGVFTAQQVTDAPNGFKNSLKITVTTADASIGATQRYILRHNIEGNNVADLAFGSASAATVSISFKVKSSLTGTFSGSLQNSAQDRGYPFTFTINSANTWEDKSVTLVGDTTGTWLTDNGVGLRVVWDLGCGSSYRATAGSWAAGIVYGATGAVQLIGTNGATFYLTGVQLEVGSAATEFEHRQYGQELALCQRYAYRISGDVDQLTGLPFTTYGATQGVAQVQFPVTMRTSPSLSFSGTARIQASADSANFTSGVSIATPSPTGTGILLTGTSGMIAGQSGHWQFRANGSYLLFSAEL